MKRSRFREGQEMKFLADECCDIELVSSLRRNGHDVLYVVESKMQEFLMTRFCSLLTMKDGSY